MEMLEFVINLFSNRISFFRDGTYIGGMGFRNDFYYYLYGDYDIANYKACEDYVESFRSLGKVYVISGEQLSNYLDTVGETWSDKFSLNIVKALKIKEE